ncbi:hypothetical protein ACFE04_010326 [Oxalis oulophora]
MGLLSNKISRDELKPGDHIYSWRQTYIYAHHGIYVGDGKVVHFTRGKGKEIIAPGFLILSSNSVYGSENPCQRCRDQSMLNGVVCSCIDCFLSGGKLYLFPYNVSKSFFLAKTRGGTCTLAESDPVEEVIRRAWFLLENGFGAYHLFKNNCEDFAIYCKTGLLADNSVSVGRSGQASTPLYASFSALISSPYLTSSFGGMTAIGYGLYCYNRYFSDISKRHDVSKVPVELLVIRFGVAKGKLKEQ